MKNDQLSNKLYSPISIVNQKEKIKIITKINKIYPLKETIILKYNYIKKPDLSLNKNNKVLNIEIESTNNNNIQKKNVITEISKLNNGLKDINDIKKDNFIKHKTSFNMNNSYNNKIPIIYTKKIKTFQIKNMNYNNPKNKNNNNITVTDYLNKKEYKSYNKSPFSNTNKQKLKNRNHNNIKDIILNNFNENKIIMQFRKKLSYDKSYKNINLIPNKKIYLNNNNNKSSPLLLIKNINNTNKSRQKKLIQNTNTTHYEFKPQMTNYQKYKYSSFHRNQKNFFKNKKIYLSRKDSRNKKNSISVNNSYFNKNRISTSKTKVEKRNINHLKKYNNNLLNKISLSCKSYDNKDKNFSFFQYHQQNKRNNLKIDTESKKQNMTMYKEDNKLKRSLNFNYLHHYLKNTISTINKMVLKKPEEKSSPAQKNDIKTDQKVTSVIKVNRYSFANRNIIIKLDKLKMKEKEKENGRINTQENFLKHSIANRKNLTNISDIVIPNINNNINYFNGNIDDYLITKELGKGSYATVKLALHRYNKNKYAIKIYSKESLIDPQKRSTVKNEINILKQLDNVNIMKLYEVIDSPKYLYLVMEYINGISLLETLKQDKKHYFEEERAIKIFIQVVKGMIYCQKKNICHRDIKLENILLVKDDVVKIIDFGFAVKTTKETYQRLFCGTPSYMAPEIVNKEKYIAQYSDIWSLGVLFYAMIYGRFPFRAREQDELFERINQANVIYPSYIEVNENVKNLLRKIFVVIPTQRLSLNEILNELEILDN